MPQQTPYIPGSSSRRSFLRNLCVGGLACRHTPGFLSASAAPAAQRPGGNVLFVICDDLAATILLEHPQVSAPNYRRLAQRGVSFVRAHCPAPICSPSRASLLTGLYPHTTGFFGQDQQRHVFRRNPLLGNAVTMMEHFAGHGYDTLGTGKIFHNGHDDPTVWRSSGREAVFGIAPSFGPMPWDGRTAGPAGRLAHPDLPAPIREYGPQAWDLSFGSLADVPNVPPNPETGAPGYHGWREGNKPFRYVNDDDRDLMSDEMSARWAAVRLRESRERPFFMAVGFSRPHTPLVVPDKYFAAAPSLDELILPPALATDLDDCAPELLDPARANNIQGFERYRRYRAAARGGDALLRRFFRAYLASIAFADAQLGLVLDALEEGPHANTTHIVFTSDHGYHFGEKRYLFKNTLWSPSTRVPLVIAGPSVAKPGSECLHPVSTVHVYSTLNDLCGLPFDPNRQGNKLRLDGQSLRPFLETPDLSDWQGPSGALVATPGTEPLAPNVPAPRDRQHYSYVTRHYRYTRAADGGEELYDLKADPSEWKNLAGVPAYQDARESLASEMNRAIGRT